MKKILIFLIMIFSVSSVNLYACTTIKFQENNNVVFGRNFDWPNKYSFLVINAIGKKHIENDLSKNAKPLNWISKYGSMTFDLANKNGQPIKQAVVDGINQYGLVASILWLGHSQYPAPSKETELSSGLWAQYILDNAKTVSEAVTLMKNINIEPTNFQGKKILVHLMVTDAEGHSAIFEYIDGKLKIFTGKNVPISALTNTAYTHALSLLKEFKHFGGNKSLPGGYYTETRFVLAANFLRLLPKTDSLSQLIAYNFDALGYLIELPGSESPTQWSVVYDLKNRVIYYRDIDNQKIRYLKLSDVNFNGKHYKAFLINNILSGNIVNNIQKS